MNDSIQTGLQQEAVPSLSDFATEVGGAWPAGWYSATITSGYSTGSGKVIETGDALSRNGDSRNLRLAFTISTSKDRSDEDGHTAPAGGTRNISQTINYNPDDLTPEGLKKIADAREYFKGIRGAWSDKDAQRASLSVGRLGQLEKALGFKLPRRSDGTGFLVSPLTTQRLDVRVKITDEGFNEVNAFAKSGSHVR